MRILITNIVVLNGGDGAILFGMLKSLRLAFGDDTEFIVFASKPATAERMYPEVSFGETIGLAATRSPRIRYLGRIIRELRSAIYLGCAWCHANGLRFIPRLFLGRERCRDFDTYTSADLVVSSGGTYLKEDYGIDSQICDYRITLLLRRRLAFYTQTLGPFKRRDSCSALRPIFNASSAVLLRDERSRRNLIEIGVKPDALRVSPDAAFALADPAVLNDAALRRLPVNRPLRIAISVRRWTHFKGMTEAQGMERYTDFMVAICGWLINELNAEVTFLSTCQGNPEYDDDSETAGRILARLAPALPARVTLISEFVRFDALLERIPQFDLVLATRMHMAILSLIAGTPAIPLVLEFKTNELYANLGLGDWVMNVEEFDEAGARNKISDFLARIDGLRSELFSCVEQQRVGAIRSGLELKTLLNK